LKEASTIRVATRSDAEGIARTRVEGWQSAYRGIMPDAFLDSMSVAADLERMASWAWDEGGTSQWVSEVDGEIVGWACMIIPARDESLGDDVAEIAACYVRPTVWGGGHGHRLMTEALDAARKHGVTEVILWVLEDNAQAQHFYTRQGFEHDGARKLEDHLPQMPLAVVRMRQLL